MSVSGRAASALACSSILALATAVAAPHASASTDLTVNVVPTQVVVDQAYEWVPFTIGGPAAGSLSDAIVGLEHYATRESVDSQFLSDGVRSGRFRIYDWQLRPGRQQASIELAYDTDYNELFGGTDSVDIRFGSKTGLSTSRSGSTVTLRATGKRYSSFGEWRSNPYTTVQFQVKLATGKWSGVATRTLSSAGTVTMTYRRATAAEYRVVSSPNAAAWGSTSAVSRR
ncbi:hypothetical protein [Knoellia sp. LjRoot47]|uniref:hypothetical protein n=1 Tax=Knoellia sp. LjRoot47 TaxID=3342330 RepID=UPI003ECF12CF